MQEIFRSMHRFLDRPLSLPGRVILLIGIALLVLGAMLPLWRIELVAPQYAEGLRLDMYTYKIVAGHDGQDLPDADGERLLVSARSQMVLRCGKPSITLTRDRKVLSHDAYGSSRSAGASRGRAVPLRRA